MKAIIIDGWHSGSVHEIPAPLPTFRLIKPRSVTVCDCDDISDRRTETEDSIKEYRLASVSNDREVALYTEKGDLFDPLTRGRTWIVKDRSVAPRTPIYYCYDERAF